MPSVTRPPTFPGIPAPPNEKVLLPTITALREAVEMLTGQRTTDGKSSIDDLNKRIDDLDRRIKVLEGSP